MDARSAAVLFRATLTVVASCVAEVCGAGLLIPSTEKFSAVVLFGWSVFWFLTMRVPALLHPRDIGAWYDVCEMAVVLAAAWALAIRLANGQGIGVARVLFAMPLVLFGVGHLMLLQATAGLVPACLPWHAFWAVATACTFFAAALAVLTGIAARLAAALVASQMALFMVTIYLPRILRHTATPFQVNEAVVSTVLAVSAWVIAESYRAPHPRERLSNHAA